jgi:serralysin
MSAHHRPLRRASVVTLTALLGLGLTAGVSATATPSSPSGEQGSQKRFVPEHTTGKEAVARLGKRRLEQLAKKSDLTARQLERTILRDRTLQVDEFGNLMVGDSLGGTGASVRTGAPDTLIWSTDQTFRLHSRPSSPLKIYLDFTGHTTTGTQWNTQYSSFTTPAWTRDSSSGFSSAEAAAIQNAFASVAEDFAAWNVDVTTQDPGVEGLRRTSSTDTAYGIRIVVGANTWLNVTNSGYAKIGSFSWNSDTPAYCFTKTWTSTKQIAECISHETGHTVGLLHDGQNTTAGRNEYYQGHANWAPIMGDSYYRSVTQWSKGQYAGATQTQDDLYVVGNYLGWLADDVVGTTATTHTLPAGTTRSGRITYGSGEYDAYKFSLSVRRTVNIQSWEWYQQVDTNLNTRIQVTNGAGTVIAQHSPTGTTRTNLNVTLNPGTYYVFVDGVGEGTASTGYTNYASMGFYNLYLQLL